MSIGVLCAVRGPGESVVVTALGSGATVTVVRRCADLAELLAASAAGLGHLAVVSADLPHLDREAVAQLHAARVRVLALTGTVPGQVERMGALGVDAVVDDDPPGPALLAAVLALAQVREDDLGGRPQGWPARADGAGGAADRMDPADRADLARLRAASGDWVETGPAPAAAGRVVAVWGPAGAPGRSTVAINLAAELAELADRGAVGAAHAGVLLIDADTYGGTVAQLLGMLDESPGLAAAARAAALGGLDRATFARLTPVLAPGLRVLTGISRASRWPELSASALEVVWELARGLAAWTVVDCGFCLEQDEALSYDTRAPRRNEATISALEAADVVVVVGSGDPVGVQRLVRGLADLANLPEVAQTRRIVVVNRLRTSAAGPRPGEAIAASLQRFAGIEAPHVIPDDGAGVDAAVLRGATLREVAPGSPVRRAISGLAVLVAQPVTEPRRRGRRALGRSARR